MLAGFCVELGSECVVVPGTTSCDRYPSLWSLCGRPGTYNRIANLSKILNLNFAVSWLSIDTSSVSESLKFYAQRTSVILNESFWNFAYSTAMYWPYWANSKILHITLQSVLDESLKFCTKHGSVLLRCALCKISEILMWWNGCWQNFIKVGGIRFVRFEFKMDFIVISYTLIAPCVLVFPVALGIIKQF